MGDAATDLSLFVRNSDYVIRSWDRSRIVAALERETEIDHDLAVRISEEVEHQIFGSKIKTITAPLVRELVNAKLIENGLDTVILLHTRLGMPLYDVDQLILHPNKENANVPHGPEGTNLTLAESIKKEYALLKIFPKNIADAHMRGDIHIHDLGFCDRPYCSGQSLEYVKKFGLNLPNALSIAKPAKHPEVLLAHMVKFAATLQGHFAGAIGWDAVNLFFAPYLVGLHYSEIKQLAQIMIFEFSQQAVARGGQAIFSDINIYWEIPKHFEDVSAIGPGGTYTGKNYSEYSKESQDFAWALFDVYKEGDALGRPFFFPKPLVHITEKFFKTERHMDFLHHICDIASVKGNTYFVFDRGSTAKISECCRLSFKLNDQDLLDAKEPWKMRYCALQNVTLNLPRIGYQHKNDGAKIFSRITDLMEMTAEAHIRKLSFIEKLMNLGSDGPLALLTMKNGEDTYLKLHKASYLIGMVGLDELVKVHIGEQMHQSKNALMFGLKVISQMKITAEKLSKRYGMHFVLEQTPAESTAYRFAKLDIKYYPLLAEKYVKGSIADGEVYYTNSSQIDIAAPDGPIDRVLKEGLFHPLIEAGALTHIWLGESEPSKESLANFVIKVFRKTLNDQIAFSPEFTTCNICEKTNRGLHEKCPSCGSEEVECITRITGYFTKVSSWNKGKIGELRDRQRVVVT